MDDQEDQENALDDAARRTGGVGESEIDKWPAWMLLIAGSLTTFLVCGFSLTLGPFFVVLQQEFHEGSGVMAGIVSVNFAAYCVAAVLGGFVVKRTSCRFVMVIGCILSVAGLIGTYFANNIYVILALFGVVSGMGYGFAYMGITITLATYFKRYRTIAISISFAGSSLGRVVFPLTSQLLIDALGWRGAFLIMAGVAMHGIPASLFYWLRTSPTLGNAKGMMPQADEKVEREQCDNETNVDSHESKEQDYCLSSSQNFTSNSKSHKNKKEKSIRTKRDKSSQNRTIVKELMTKWTYLLLLVNSFSFFFGFVAVITHVVPQAIESGMDKYLAVVLLTLLGVGNFTGRFGTGFIAHLPCVNPYLFFAITLILCGVSAFFLVVPVHFVIAIIIAFSFALLASVYEPMAIEITLLVTTPQQFTIAWALINVPSATGAFLGAPVVGWMYDGTGYYPASFFFGGSLLILSGLVILPIYIRDRRKSVALNQHDTKIIETEDGVPCEVILSPEKETLNL